MIIKIDTGINFFLFSIEMASNTLTKEALQTHIDRLLETKAHLERLVQELLGAKPNSGGVGAVGSAERARSNKIIELYNTIDSLNREIDGMQMGLSMRAANAMPNANRTYGGKRKTRKTRKSKKSKKGSRRHFS